MHSHDRTMLAKFGFADPDKRNPVHDQACLFLADMGTARAVLKGLLLPAWPDIDRAGAAAPQTMGFHGHRLRQKAEMEFHLQKGEGQYATTVGFIDVAYGFAVDGVERGHPWTLYDAYGRPRQDESRVEDRPRTVQGRVFVEVKIEPVRVTDVIRQMKLYADYFPYPVGASLPDDFPRGILAAPWDLTATEAEALGREGFRFVRLGDGFDRWRAEADRTRPAPKRPTIEL